MARPRRTGAFIESEVLRHWRTQVAGAAGFGLWAAALAWSDENLTDGHVPKEAASRLLPGARSAVPRVTKAGFWSECMEHADCFELHRYAEDGRGRPRQPTRARLDEEREKQRQRDLRKKEFPEESRRESAGNPAGTARELVSDDSGVDTPSSNKYPPVVPPQGEPRRRRRALSPDWTPNDKHREYAGQHRIDSDAEAGKFRDYHAMKGTLALDWDAGFRNWLVRAVEYRDARNPQTADLPPRKKFT